MISGSQLPSAVYIQQLAAQQQQHTRMMQATTAPPRQRNKQRMIQNMYIVLNRISREEFTQRYNTSREHYQLPVLQTCGPKISEMVMRMLATKIVEEQLGERKLQEIHVYNIPVNHINHYR